jgi:hypothetical protein
MKEAPKKLKPTHISAVGWLEARGVADAHIRLNGKSMRSLVQGSDDTCSFYTNCSNVHALATHTRRNATDKEATSGAHTVPTAGHVQLVPLTRATCCLNTALVWRGTSLPVAVQCCDLRESMCVVVGGKRPWAGDLPTASRRRRTEDVDVQRGAPNGGDEEGEGSGTHNPGPPGALVSGAKHSMFREWAP